MGSNASRICRKIGRSLPSAYEDNKFQHCLVATILEVLFTMTELDQLYHEIWNDSGCLGKKVKQASSSKHDVCMP